MLRYCLYKLLDFLVYFLFCTSPVEIILHVKYGGTV